MKFQVNELCYEIISEKDVKVTWKEKGFFSPTYPSLCGTIHIPATIIYEGKKYNVTSIGDRAFYRCHTLTSISIPNSITKIGNFAFKGCSSLTSVIIPNSVKNIGNHAFANCSALILVTIPASVTNIEVHAFANCSSLVSITIPNSITNIKKYMFEECSSLTSVTIPNSVTNIENNAFAYCSSLISITIPDSVTSIGNNAFTHCSSLVSVIIPNSVTIIEKSAFIGCTSLNDINIPNNVTSIKESTFEGCISLNSVTIPNNVRIIEKSAFKGCISLHDVNMSNGVRVIEKYAFKNCISLKVINMPNCVATIGESAFEGCVSLNFVNIPNNVTSICECTFEGCTSLSSVTIPNSVTSIGKSAFKDCTSLTSVTIPIGVINIKESAFYGCTSLTSVIIPNSIINIEFGVFDDTALYKNTSNWINGVLYIDNCLIKAKENITGNYHISAGTKVIAEFAFQNCSLLNSVIIPDSVIYIGTGAFNKCTSLVSINIPKDVTNMDSNTFIGCEKISTVIWCANYCPNVPFLGISITEFRFENNVKEIPAGLCKGMKIKQLIISDSIERIGNNAFKDCKTLESVSLGKNVKYIGNRAFANCSALTSVNMCSKVQRIGNEAFSGCQALLFIDLSSKVQHIGHKAFKDCQAMLFAILPNNLTSIEAGTFSGCESLNTIYIPKSVKKIDYDAFVDTALYKDSQNWKQGVLYIDNCLIKADKDLYGHHDIVNGTRVIAESAFENCIALSSVTIPNSVTSIGANVFYNTALYNNTSNWENGVLYIDHCLIEAQNLLDCHYDVKKETRMIADYAFFELKELLSSVSLPVGLTNIGYAAFDDTALYSNTSNKINGGQYVDHCLLKVEANTKDSFCVVNGTQMIADYAFEGCNGLFSVTIPESVTYIGRYVLQGCDHIHSLRVCANIPPAITEETFANVDKTIDLYVPAMYLDRYRNTEGWNAFQNMKSLETIEAIQTNKLIGDMSLNGTILQNPQKEEITLYNRKGQIVYNGHDIKIHLPSAGVYILKTERGAQKLVI